MATDQNIILGIKGQDQGALALFQAAQKELADMGAEQKRLNTELKQYERIAQQANKVTRNSNGNYKEANRTSRMARGGIGQLGYQIQDVAVQVQGGQNLGLILGQQGSQIASVFGTGGIVAGAIISIGALIATTMVPRLFESGQEAKLLDEIFKDLNDTLLTVGNDGVFTLKSQFEELARVNQDYAKVTLMSSLLKAQEAIRLSQEGMATSADEVAFTMYTSQRVAENFAESLGISAMQAAALSAAAIALQRGVEGADTALVELTNTIALDPATQATKQFADFALAVNKFAMSEGRAQEQIELINEVMGDLDGALANNTQSEQARTAAVEKSIAAMQLQLDTYGRTETETAIITAAINGATAAELSRIEAIQLKIQALRDADEQEKAATKAAMDSQKAAEKAAQDERTRLDQGRQYAQNVLVQTSSDEQQYLAKYEERLSRLRELRALDLENATLYNEAILALEGERSSKIVDFEQKKQEQLQRIADQEKANKQDAMNFLSQTAGQLESSFEEGSKAQKAAFLVNQGIAAANAFVNTNEAASKHLGSPMYGVIMAMGMANVAAIVGQTLGSFDGGGFTGMGARTGGVDGKGGFPAILHPNETVIDHSKGQGMSGNITVNINAVDTKGFDELLYKRRGQLVSIINQAVNNRGRASIV